MVEVETEIEIAAPPERVWEVLTDFGAFPEWNPMIPEVRGTPAPGATLAVRIALGKGRKVGVKAKVVEWEPARAFAWKGSVPGIFTGVHFWRLSPSAAGTRLVHGERFSGLVPWLLGERMLSLRPSYQAMNTALAQRVLARRNAGG